MDEEIIRKRMAFFRKVPVFVTLREDDLRAISTQFRARNYGKKEIIFHQGDETHDFYLNKRGKVRVFCNSPSGNETSIRVLSANEMIGEFAPIDGQPRSATAQAITDCTLLELPQEGFLRCLREQPNFTMTLLRLLVQKLRMMTEYAETIAQYDIGGRLLHIILYYNAKIGKEIEKNFVTRLKENADYTVIEEKSVPMNRNILADQLIQFTGYKARKNCRHILRRVVVWDKNEDREIVLLTNHLEFGATTISAIYKDRWQLELFFKALKQNLKVNTFVGTTENAPYIQIWTALIAILLIKYLQFKSKFA